MALFPTPNPLLMPCCVKFGRKVTFLRTSSTIAFWKSLPSTGDSSRISFLGLAAAQFSMARSSLWLPQRFLQLQMLGAQSSSSVHILIPIGSVITVAATGSK
jgi:hypothetical protein